MKACRVCGVEGRALCFPCTGKLSAKSPKHKAHVERLHKEWSGSPTNLARLERLNKSPEHKAQLKRLHKEWNGSLEQKAHIERLHKEWSGSSENKAQLTRIRQLPQSKAAYRKNGRKLGRRNVGSGHLARIRQLPQSKAAYRKNGRRRVESGGLARAGLIALERGRNGTTRLQLELNRYLDELGIVYEKNYSFGPYILDAAIVDRKIDIEADGPMHDRPEAKAKDRRRDAYTKSRGWSVVRISWLDMEDVDLVRNMIIGVMDI